MPITSFHQASFSHVLLVLSVVLSCILLAVYPLQTDFPVSHEAPQYIMESLEVKSAFADSLSIGIHTLATNSWYPGTTLGLLIADLITPFSWPEIIIWLSVIIHLGIGISLGYLALRLHSSYAAAVTILLWSVAFTVMRPITNGWLANWWSLLPTVLMLERITQRRHRQAAFWLLITTLIHPLSGLVLLLTILLTLPSYLVQQPNRQKRLIVITFTALSVVMATWWLIDKAYIFHSLKSAKPVHTIGHLLMSPLAPAAILAPLGLLWFVRNHERKPRNVFLLLFWSGSVFLAFNHLWLPGGLLEWRFEPYLLLSVSLLGGIGITIAIREILQKNYLQFTLVASLMLVISIAGWHHNMQYFSAYNGNNLLIPLTKELEAIEWLKTLPENTHLLTTRNDLNYQWLHIITQHKWTGTNKGESLYKALMEGSEELQKKVIVDKKLTHLVILKNREKELLTFTNAYEQFPTIYENEAVLIKNLLPAP